MHLFPVVDGMVNSREVGTDDTLSFFTGTTAGSAEGIRKVTIDRDDFKIYDNLTVQLLSSVLTIVVILL